MPLTLGHFLDFYKESKFSLITWMAADPQVVAKSFDEIVRETAPSSSSILQEDGNYHEAVKILLTTSERNFRQPDVQKRLRNAIRNINQSLLELSSHLLPGGQILITVGRGNSQQEMFERIIFIKAAEAALKNNYIPQLTRVPLGGIEFDDPIATRGFSLFPIFGNPPPDLPP